MNPIEIISASAGSGKTHRLSEILEKAVRSKAVRPDAIIATTFTIKAAAELRERVRRRLLEAGLAEEAQQLNAAILGTVNSVCSRLVTDFAFYLGMSPELRVLDEEMADRALRRALFGAINRESDQTVARLTQSFDKWSVENHITRVVELARANGLGPAGLAASRDRCLAELDDILPAPLKSAAKLESDLKEAIQAFLKHVDRGEDMTDKTSKCADKVCRFLAALRPGQMPPWQDWQGLTKLDTGAKSKAAAAPVIALAASHNRHPQFHADVKDSVKTVFDLAALALESYAAYKRERGLIDFVDQECHSLALLKMPEVQAHLRGKLDLILVDEFQDTSPIELAIFLELAAIAKRSVWVGDQKQSIFAFRGSDPELMNSAIDKILEGADPETLPKSWRSRPELVRLTSELFARAFPRHGIPENRVRLKPALTDAEEPAGLGPIIERWPPRVEGTSNKDKRAASLAAAIKEFLSDKTIKVRDKETKKARPVEPKDIAVLCRMNATCVLVAQSLAQVGIKCALSRTGLMKTPEARLLLSALRLWSDPNDALSAAEIARLLEYPDKPERWLRALLEKKGQDAAAFTDVPAISRIREESVKERSQLGVLGAFDRIAELLAVRDVCRRWGNAPDRLANVNVLRAYAVGYTEFASEEGAGMTPAGLAAFLTGLDDGKNDRQAFSPDRDAVIVSTWHKAKGLEWPIVVLYELDFEFNRQVPDIHIATDVKKISLDDPLARRWIRYWPNPYNARAKAEYHDLVRSHKAFAVYEGIEKRESLRLLYVGWTRARDRVVLTCKEGKFTEGVFEEFHDGTSPLLSEPGNGKVHWAGRDIEVASRSPLAIEPAPIRQKAEPTYVTTGPAEFAPAWARPDLSNMKWEAGEPEILGDPISLSGKPEMINVGSAIHGFLAADRKEYPKEARLEMADGLLKRWGVVKALKADDLLEISDRLTKWVSSKWPSAKWHREQPIYQRLDPGSVSYGVSDLILETIEGVVIIDHKAYPGNIGRSKEFALLHVGQIQTYANSVFLARGSNAIHKYIHLSLISTMIET